MPIPKPKRNEKEKVFISRCMSFLAAEDSALKNDARVAACYSTWQRAKKIKENSMDNIKQSLQKITAAINKRGKKKSARVEKSAITVHGIVVKEAFISLDQAIRDAVTLYMGPSSYVYDFSNNEVIFRQRDETAEVGGESRLYKVKYKTSKGKIVFVGSSTEVTKTTSYKNEGLYISDLIDLMEMEIQVNKALIDKEKKDG